MDCLSDAREDNGEDQQEPQDWECDEYPFAAGEGRGGGSGFDGLRCRGVFGGGLGGVGERDGGVGGYDAGDFGAERGDHVAADVADLGVVEDTFKAVTDLDPAFAVVDGEEHQDTAVGLLLADLPFRK